VNHLTSSLASVLAGAKRSDSAALHLLPSAATSLRRPATGERSRRYRDIDEARQRQPGRDVRRPRPAPNIRRVRLRGLGRLGDLEHAVALVLKRHAARVGLDPDEVAGHSLRAGLATSAAAAGVPERVIASQTGHRGTAMLRRYIREGSLFRENAASAVGL